VAAAKLLADRGSPAIDQFAFADFLTAREFDRHLRRMRLLYRRRRDARLDALRGPLPDRRRRTAPRRLAGPRTSARSASSAPPAPTASRSAACGSTS
jgi:DNA-binding transcriptional MocR family regulator